jgi:hypothetical protein
MALRCRVVGMKRRNVLLGFLAASLAWFLPRGARAGSIGVRHTPGPVEGGRQGHQLTWEWADWANSGERVFKRIQRATQLYPGQVLDGAILVMYLEEGGYVWPISGHIHSMYCQCERDFTPRFESLIEGLGRWLQTSKGRGVGPMKSEGGRILKGGLRAHPKYVQMNFWTARAGAVLEETVLRMQAGGIKIDPEFHSYLKQLYQG